MRNKKAHDGNYPSHHIINAEILYTQNPQHDPTGVQRHPHNQKHAHVEEQRVLSYSLIVFGICRHKIVIEQSKAHTLLRHTRQCRE